MTNVTHFTVLDQSQDNVLGARLQGRLDDSDLEGLAQELQTRGARQGRLRVLLELKSIKNYTPEELWQAMRRNASEIEEVEKLAFVSDDEDYSRWLDALPTSLIDGEVQSFEPGDLRAAWEWVRD